MVHPLVGGQNHRHVTLDGGVCVPAADAASDLKIEQRNHLFGRPVREAHVVEDEAVRHRRDAFQVVAALEDERIFEVRDGKGGLAGVGLAVEYDRPILHVERRVVEVGEGEELVLRTGRSRPTARRK